MQRSRKADDGPLTTSTQLRRGKFKQRPGEKWQGCQLHDGVRPSIGPTAAKQQRQSDDKARVGQERVRRDPRYRDPYGCTSTQCNCLFTVSILRPPQLREQKNTRHAHTQNVAMTLLIAQKDIRQRGKLR